MDLFSPMTRNEIGHNIGQWFGSWVDSQRWAMYFVIMLISETYLAIANKSVNFLVLIIGSGVLSFFIELLTGIFCPAVIQYYMPVIVAILMVISVVVNQ